MKLQPWSRSLIGVTVSMALLITACGRNDEEQFNVTDTPDAAIEGEDPTFDSPPGRPGNEAPFGAEMPDTALER